MEKTIDQKPNYGNWVPTKMIFIPGLIGLVCLWLAFSLPVLGLLAFLFLLVSIYFAVSWVLFSPQGGNVQARIIDLLCDRLEWDGKGRALDIGCGNGPLSIRLAKRYPAAQVTGCDFWGKNWDYSIGVCQQNARSEGVAERVSFQKGSADALPFDDESYDLVVSNLTFHEVQQAKDKREVVREALRVVKKGGHFAFQDLFMVQQLYGDPQDLIDTVKSWGITRVELVKTYDAPFIPAWVKLPFMVGKIGILSGEK